MKEGNGERVDSHCRTDENGNENDDQYKMFEVDMLMKKWKKK